jgi:GNAT superfamily N-acetyltransferase
MSGFALSVVMNGKEYLLISGREPSRGKSSMPTMSVMREPDIGFATRLATEEEWGYLEEDFRRLIHFEPGGCFVAWQGGEKVGTVTTTSYGDYAFLGSLIVKKPARGTGIGEALLNHAIKYLLGKGVKTIELDGVFAAISLYRRLGFRDKYLSLRFEGEAAHHGDDVLPFGQEMVDEVVTFDEETTGLSRRRIVRRLLEEFGDSVHVAQREGVTGYAVVRPRAAGHLAIGPWIAEDRSVAEALLRSIINKNAGKVLAIGVPGPNRDAVRMLTREGFHYLEPSLRMYLGEETDYERNVYGIIAPEKG